MTNDRSTWSRLHRAAGVATVRRRGSRDARANGIREWRTLDDRAAEPNGKVSALTSARAAADGRARRERARAARTLEAPRGGARADARARYGGRADGGARGKLTHHRCGALGKDGIVLKTYWYHGESQNLEQIDTPLRRAWAVLAALFCSA